MEIGILLKAVIQTEKIITENMHDYAFVSKQLMKQETQKFDKRLCFW